MKLTEYHRLQAEQIVQKGTAQKLSASEGEIDPFLFKETLATQMGSDAKKVTFSSHALQRLEKRGITISADQMDQINQAVSKLAEKGARESLVLTDDIALVVGVKANTVITAMDKETMKGAVITNIDSAIFT